MPLMPSLARHRGVAAVILLCILWVAAVSLVNPVGDFPLNDDWSYGTTVKTWMADGQFRPLGWTSMPLVSQALWGKMFCHAFGFSFTTLRFSTLTIALFGLLACYGFMRLVGSTPAASVFASVLIGVNPIFLNLAMTFMSDVPFAALSMITILAFGVGLRRNALSWIIVGTVLSCIATLTRQLGIFLPAGFAVAYLWKKGFRLRPLVTAVVPVLSAVIALVAFNTWLNSTAGLPEMYNTKSEALLATLDKGLLTVAIKLVGRIGIAFIYLGLFLSPLLVALVPQFMSLGNRKKMLACGAAVVAIAAGATAFLASTDKLMPLTINLLYDCGLGAVTLRDTMLLNLSHAPHAPRAFWILLTFAGILGAQQLAIALLAMAGRLVRAVRTGDRDQHTIPVFIIALMSIYMLAMGLVYYFDRYLLPLLLPVSVAAVMVGDARGPRLRTRAVIPALLLTLMLACFSIAGTHDYLAWNRVRWKALHGLMTEERAAPEEIDGGFEFNGMYCYDENYISPEDKSWWWVHDDRYVVTMGEVEGYTIAREYPFSQWLMPASGRILVLKRNE
jgi:hypothetical protein